MSEVTSDLARGDDDGALGGVPVLSGGLPHDVDIFVGDGVTIWLKGTRREWSAIYGIIRGRRVAAADPATRPADVTKGVVLDADHLRASSVIDNSRI